MADPTPVVPGDPVHFDSAGEHPKAECSRVLADVWLFLDDEMDPHRRAAVQRHLDDCSPCLVELGLEAKLKALLRTKCGGDRAPEALRSRLVTSLSALSVTDSGGAVTVQVATLTVAETRGSR